MPRIPTIGHAHALQRDGHWSDAAKLFDHLNQMHPDFEPYAQGLQRVLKTLAGQKGCGSIPVVRLGGGGQEALRLRSLEVLLRHGLLPAAALAEQEALLVDGPDVGLLRVTAALQVDAGAVGSAWASAMGAWLARWGGAQLMCAPPGGDGDEKPALLAYGVGVDVEAELGLNAGHDARFGRIRLRPLGGGTLAGPSVTVAMSCFNNAATLESAALSVLGQTHSNLELVIVDDASTDASPVLLTKLAASDPRVKVHFNAVNVGAYANRNRVWAQSRADFFCCLDADDIALPERLAQQCARLQAQPQALGVVSSWVRMTTDGRPVYMNQGAGGFVHHAVSTMMLRRSPVLQSIGYWDAVRFEADSEFMERLRVVHGPQALLWDDTVTTLALSRAGSLTQDAATGLDDLFGPSPVRQQYRLAWRAWHQSGRHLYLAQDQHPRPFEAPPEMPP